MRTYITLTERISAISVSLDTAYRLEQRVELGGGGLSRPGELNEALLPGETELGRLPHSRPSANHTPLASRSFQPYER